MEDNTRRIIKGNVSLPGGDVDVMIQFTAPSSIKLTEYVQTAKDFLDSMAVGDQMRFDFESSAVGSGMGVRIDKPRKGSTKTSLTLDGKMDFEAQSALHAIMQRCGKVTVSFKGESKPKAEKKGDQTKPGMIKDIPIKEAVNDKATLDALKAAGIKTVQAGAAMNIADVHDGSGLALDTLDAVIDNCKEVLEQAQKPKDSKAKTGAASK